jgi:hypothetical protein
LRNPIHLGYGQTDLIDPAALLIRRRGDFAAKEIKGLIEDSVSRVNTGSVLVESAGDTMSNIVRRRSLPAPSRY